MGVGVSRAGRLQAPVELGEVGGDLQATLAALRRHPALRQPIETPRRLLCTGLAAVDKLLGGGLPAGAITEVVSLARQPVSRQSMLSAGRTSVALAIAAAATRRGELVAWIDTEDALDPLTLEATGARLDCWLWVRPRGRDACKRALKAADIVLSAGGFATVVIDMIGALAQRQPMPTAVWVRLAHRLAGNMTALVVLTSAPLVGTSAQLRLECQWRQADHERRGGDDVPRQIEIAVAKQRGAEPGRRVHLPIDAPVD